MEKVRLLEQAWYDDYRNNAYVNDVTMATINKTKQSMSSLDQRELMSSANQRETMSLTDQRKITWPSCNRGVTSFAIQRSRKSSPIKGETTLTVETRGTTLTNRQTKTAEEVPRRFSFGETDTSSDDDDDNADDGDDEDDDDNDDTGSDDSDVFTTDDNEILIKVRAVKCLSRSKFNNQAFVKLGKSLNPFKECGHSNITDIGM